jgi:FkbM family methyltransferase
VPQVIDPELARLLDVAPGLSRVLLDLPMQALDVGARRGFADDLLPLAPAIDGIAFEPDADECENLNAEVGQGGHPWRSIRYIPAALGPDSAEATLNLYHQRGCSSLLEAVPELAAQFSRDRDYALEDKVSVTMMGLDDAAQRYGFSDAVFMKIDVQGFEGEVFRSGEALMSGPMLAVRSEVTAIPLYRDMPLIEDIIVQMRGYGFLPMSFEEVHHWRRSTRVKHPRLSDGPIPYSRGQLVHGDILFFRDPDTLPDDAEILLKAAFLALTYGHIDHAVGLMQRQTAARWLQDRYQLDPMAELSAVSRRHLKLYRKQMRRQKMADRLFRIRQFVTN